MEKQVKPALALIRPGVESDLLVPTEDNVRSWSTQMGSYNLHLPIKFEDGKRWVVRIRSGLLSPLGDAKVFTAIDLASTRVAHDLAPTFVLRTFTTPERDCEWWAD